MEQTKGIQKYGQLSLKLLALSLATGCVAGLAAIVFRAMIGLIHNLAFFGRFSFAYDANLHTDPSPLGVAIILVPVAGALGVAWLVKNFAPEAKGHGVPEVIHSIYYKHGRIRPAVALVKSMASALSIGSGGSVGREGPIIQIGAAFGSTLAQWTRLPEWQRTTLIAAGAGGGIAATFNTPLGGLLFAVELIMTEISARTLVPVVLAVVTAITIGRLYFGDHPSFLIPPLELQAHQGFGPEVLLAYLVLGVLLGLCSVIMIRAIYGFEDLFERMPGNYYSRHVLGMALVGLLIYALQARLGHYYVQGVGYATVQDILDGVLRDPGLLLLLLAAKLLATSLTLGSGASGGVFSPSLFLGACLGAGYAYLARVLLPGLPLDPVAGAVIGMGGMVAGSTGAALTAMVMILEMTREYHAVLPLMLVVGSAYGVRRLLMQDSIYSMKLSRRDQPVPQSLHTAILFLRSVADLADTPIREAENPTTGSARVHQVLRREGAVDALWPAGVPESVPALALAPDTPVLDAVGFLRAAGAGAVVITADSDPRGPALGALSLAEISHHGHLPPAYLGKPRLSEDRGKSAILSSIDSQDAERLSTERLFTQLKSSPQGLGTAEAQARLETFGRNAFEEKKVNPLTRFLGDFWGPIPWMIEVAAVLSAISGAWADLAIILALLVFNALVGFWEEHKAAKTLVVLKSQLALKARVLRDGRRSEVDAAELVPGDIVRLRRGDIVPADAKLVEGEHLSVDSSALSGESLPVTKKLGEVVYSGSVVEQGEMVALVTATGGDTFFGRAARLVKGAGTASHFQKAVLAIADYLTYLTIALVTVLVIVQLFRHAPLLELVQFALILAVTSIPVAMPAVLSVTMAVGALALSKMKAIVSRLQSIEEMAGVDILCSDKTGTLTQNRLTRGKPVLFDPPREDSAQAIREAGEHGIEVKLVTGDDVTTAREISGQLGMGRDIQPANALIGGGAPLPDAAARIEQTDGFAQVSPEHKFGIVTALQERNHLVAMTGDGVNDAPALEQADVGIAVSGATDAARAAADLILTAPGPSVITRAVEEARRIFERMTSYILYRIVMTIDIMAFVVLATLVLGVYPLTAIMIVMLALLDDIPIMAMAYDRTSLSPVAVRFNMHRVLTLSGILGFLSMVQSFGLMYFADRVVHMDPAHLQSAVFLQLVVGGHLMLFVTRSRGAFWRAPYPAWPLFGAIVVTQILAVLMTGFGWLVPQLPWRDIGWIWVYNLAWMVVLDLAKLGSNRLMEHRAGLKQRFLAHANRPLHRLETRR